MRSFTVVVLLVDGPVHRALYSTLRRPLRAVWDSPSSHGRGRLAHFTVSSVILVWVFLTRRASLTSVASAARRPGGPAAYKCAGTSACRACDDGCPFWRLGLEGKLKAGTPALGSPLQIVAIRRVLRGLRRPIRPPFALLRLAPPGSPGGTGMPVSDRLGARRWVPVGLGTRIRPTPGTRSGGRRPAAWPGRLH
ncbi:MAG: hypothetical protein QOE57_1398 [Acidimicrobiaceae bacterium]|nr:hypothetical protein [Acidimicrobiaceae bacterium]